MGNVTGDADCRQSMKFIPWGLKVLSKDEIFYRMLPYFIAPVRSNDADRDVIILMSHAFEVPRPWKGESLHSNGTKMVNKMILLGSLAGETVNKCSMMDQKNLTVTVEPVRDGMDGMMIN